MRRIRLRRPFRSMLLVLPLALPHASPPPAAVLFVAEASAEAFAEARQNA